jgi:TPR repeat protein
MEKSEQDADQRHAEAQNNLGLMYEIGRGVAQDEKQGVLYIQKAAEQAATTV